MHFPMTILNTQNTYLLDMKGKFKDQQTKIVFTETWIKVSEMSNISFHNSTYGLLQKCCV